MVKVIVSGTAMISLLLNVACLIAIVYGAIEKRMDLLGACVLIEILSAIVTALLFGCVMVVFERR